MTKKQEQFIKRHHTSMSCREIGIALGGIPKGTIQSALKRWGIKKTKAQAAALRAKGIEKRYANIHHPEDEVIKKKYLTVNVNQLAILVGRSETFVLNRMEKLGLVIPPEIIEQRKIDSQIKKGNVPPNKGRKQVEYMSPEMIERTKATRFQKGRINHNELQDGAITIRHDHPNRPGSKPHKYIRIAKGKWKELQIYNWEKKFGPIPKGHVLACKDGDTLNCKVSNWELISMADNMRRNTIHRYPGELRQVIMLTGKISKKLKKLKDEQQQSNRRSA